MRVVGRDEMKDATLLIQGPLKEDTYKFYCRFYPEIPKVFSTWRGNQKANDWRGDTDLHSERDIFIESEPPNRIGCWERRIELDVVGTLLGLDKVKTEIVVRLRGDEWYSNLNHVKEMIEKDSEGKLFIAPVFLKKWEAWPFRMGDHIIGGKADDVRMMFETCLANIVTRSELHEECWPLPYQSILARGYLEKKRPGGVNTKEDFRSLFGLVDLERLKLYKVSSDAGKQSWYSNFKPSIANLEDI